MGGALASQSATKLMGGVMDPTPTPLLMPLAPSLGVRLLQLGGSICHC